VDLDVLAGALVRLIDPANGFPGNHTTAAGGQPLVVPDAPMS
jgi:hypothetical protein